jgi:hypothetical protein
MPVLVFVLMVVVRSGVWVGVAQEGAVAVQIPGDWRIGGGGHSHVSAEGLAPWLSIGSA